MAVLFSSIVAAQERGSSRSSFSAQALDLAPLGDLKSSVLVCDDFRVSGRPFPLHPHAGFVAAISWSAREVWSGLMLEAA